MGIARRTMLQFLGSASLLSFAAPVRPRSILNDDVNWPEFLARHDLIWERLPKAWDEGPFLGNGTLGAMIYWDPARQALRLDIGSNDVRDHRTPFRHANYDDARLPIGHFLLRTRGNVIDRCKLRLVLHDAMLIGEVVTDQGAISLRAYVHANDMAIVVETQASGEEQGVEWEWVGEEAISPRQTFGITKNQPDRILAGYTNNPSGVRASEGAEELWLQPLLAGGGTATAWRATPEKLIVSVAHHFPGDGARAEALASVRHFASNKKALQQHIDWWNKYYRASFITIPDMRMESFYWIQIYKLASATRADRSLIDNQGPWLQATPWPSSWWNLNTQLTYWTPIVSNHIDLMNPLIDAVHNNHDTLINNVRPEYRHDSASMSRTSAPDLVSPVEPPKENNHVALIEGQMSASRAPEMGNLPWALHNIWLVWRHTMDETLLRDKLFPILRRTTNYYRHFLKKGKDGKLHLPVTYSPEYGAAPDLNYDIALLRWSCLALLEATKRLRIDDPLIPEWRKIIVDLVEYPQDETGYMIGAGLPLKDSQRHYSHLLMVYPLCLVNREQPAAAELVERSVNHWQSMPEQLRGYSSTGASSISSAFGKGDRALKYLQGLIDEHLRPNSLYKEGGPVIETPLSGAQSILDMLLQSWGGAIRPFPAVPSIWADCAFADLSAEGAFLVSGQRRAGATSWVKVTSKAGEPFEIITDIIDPIAFVDDRPRELKPVGTAGRLTARVERGETIIIYPNGSQPRIYVGPVIAAGSPNSFGLRVKPS